MNPAQRFAHENAGRTATFTFTWGQVLRGRIVGSVDGCVLMLDMTDPPWLMATQYGQRHKDRAQLLCPVQDDELVWSTMYGSLQLEATGAPVDIGAGRFPHSCPRCSARAYVGAYRIDCSSCGAY